VIFNDLIPGKYQITETLNLNSFNENKSNTLQAFWIAMGNLSSFAVSIISAAVLSRYFEKSEYGTYRQILYVYSTLLVVFSAGLPAVYSYFLPRYSLAQGKEVVTKITKVLFLAGFCFSIFLYTFSTIIADILKNPDLRTGLKYFAPIPFLLLPTLGIEGIFSTYKKTIFIAGYNILTRIMMLLFIVLPVVLFKGSYIYAIIGWVVVSLLTLVLADSFKGIPFKGIKTEKSGLTLKEIFTYSLPLGFASLAGIATKASDQFYISRFFGTEVFAEFANGFIELPLVAMITGATATVLMPVFSKIIYDKSDVTQLISIWHSTLHKSVILIYPMVIFFMFYSREIMAVLYTSKYSVSSTYFTLAMALNFFNVIIFAPLLLSLGETKFYAKLHFWIAVISWLFGYLIIIFFRTPLSIAIFSVVLSIIKIEIAMIYSAKIIGVSPLKLFPVGRLLVIALHSAFSVLVANQLLSLILPQIGNMAILTLGGLIFLVLLWTTSKWFKIDYWLIIAPLLYNKRQFAEVQK